MSTDTSKPGYADALAELDAILRELETSDVDVDRLAERVARASELIALCRDRISAARLRIRMRARFCRSTTSDILRNRCCCRSIALTCFAASRQSCGSFASTAGESDTASSVEGC